MRTSPTARIFRPTPRNLALLANVLARGGLVAAPTETVYGLAADARNAKACRAIFRAKGRPANDPLIVHVSSLDQASEVAQLNEAALAVAFAFWPGPLTLVLPKQVDVPSIVTSGQESVAVRMPAHPLFRELIERSSCPLAAPSANPFGYISPTTAGHVLDGLGHRISYILDGGPAEIGVESTILDLRDPRQPAILRPGSIAQDDLARVLGCKVLAYTRKVSSHAAAPAPGMLERHYSPSTPLTLTSNLSPDFLRNLPNNHAVLFIYQPELIQSNGNIFWLAKQGDGLTAAAHHLFNQLREVDSGGWTHIHAELAHGNSALALAINDRLLRAAAKRT